MLAPSTIRISRIPSRGLAVIFLLLALLPAAIVNGRSSIDQDESRNADQLTRASAPVLLRAHSHLLSDYVSQLWRLLSHAATSDNSRHSETSFAVDSNNQQRQNKNSQRVESASSAVEPTPRIVPSHKSKITVPGQVVNNSPPDDIPSARLVAALTDAGDGNHMLLSVLVGASNVSKTVPDSQSVALKFVIDTGSSDLLLYNFPCSGTTYCDTVGAASLTPSTLSGGKCAFTLDGESYQIYGSWSNNLLTVPLTLMGTSQLDYTIRSTLFFVGDGQLSYAPANPNNVDNSDPTSSYLNNADYFTNADGALGLSYYSGSLVPYLNPQLNLDASSQFTGFQTLVNDASPVFSMNFRASKFYFGGIDEEYREKLLWSDGPSSYATGLHSFRIYQMRICGVNLFENITSNWHAIVDTGSSCLGLPAEFYDMVISWLPVQCNLGKFDQLPHICYMSGHVLPILPTISFRVSPQGQDLYINLSELLFLEPIANSDPLNRTCIYRSGSITRGPGPYSSIVFGSRVMHQLYAAFDMRSQTVGFANSMPITESTTQCATPVNCVGMQVHNDALNVCLPPACGDYYFFVYDDPSKQCKLSTGFHILIGLTIGIFVFAEFGLNEAVIYLSNKVNQNAIHAGQ